MVRVTYSHAKPSSDRPFSTSFESRSTASPSMTMGTLEVENSMSVVGKNPWDTMRVEYLEPDIKMHVRSE
jgi:hypothetical protein